MIAGDFNPRWIRKKKQLEIARWLRGSGFNLDMRIETFIAFDEAEDVAGCPIEPVLDYWAEQTSLAVSAIKAEIDRLNH